ncbi:LysR family transcriptional regulator [Pseudomonas sp. NPDC007930]|uniref:LysR family transcriptional regulator n=1 Tax=Pseudomonas sp. NPDC007930 TaxID=3364417 RepID=UPI0036EC3C45
MIDEQVFSGIDLNSVLTLLVLERERNVSRAARFMGVKQPAMSNHLAKLRRYFADPLFVRKGRGVVPTAKAQALASALAPAYLQLQGVLRQACGQAPGATPNHPPAPCTGSPPPATAPADH